MDCNLRIGFSDDKIMTGITDDGKYFRAQIGDALVEFVEADIVNSLDSFLKEYIKQILITGQADDSLIDDLIENSQKHFKNKYRNNTANICGTALDAITKQRPISVSTIYSFIDMVLADLYPFFMHSENLNNIEGMIVKSICRIAHIITDYYNEKNNFGYIKVLKYDFFETAFKRMGFHNIKVDKHYRQYLKIEYEAKGDENLDHYYIEEDINHIIDQIVDLSPLADIISSQEKFRKALFWVLDSGNTDLLELTGQQRLFLFNNLYNYPIDPVAIHKGDLSVDCITVKDELEKVKIISEINESISEDRKRTSMFPNDIFLTSPDDNIKVSTHTIDLIKKYDFKISEVYDIEMLDQMLYFEFLKMVDYNITVKKCAYQKCGKYFINNKYKNAMYCDRVPKGETKPCNVVAPRKNYAAKLRDSEIAGEYRKRYKKLFGRIKIAAIPKEEQARFNKWKTKAEPLRDEALKTNMDFELFKKELDDIERSIRNGR